MQEARAVASGHLEDTEIAVIDEADAATDRLVLRGGVAVSIGQLDVAGADEDRAGRGVEIVECQTGGRGTILNPVAC